MKPVRVVSHPVQKSKCVGENNTGAGHDGLEIIIYRGYFSFIALENSDPALVKQKINPFISLILPLLESSSTQQPAINHLRPL